MPCIIAWWCRGMLPMCQPIVPGLVIGPGPQQQSIPQPDGCPVCCASAAPAAPHRKDATAAVIMRPKGPIVRTSSSFKNLPPPLELILVDLAASEALLENVEGGIMGRPQGRVGTFRSADHQPANDDDNSNNDPSKEQ